MTAPPYPDVSHWIRRAVAHCTSLASRRATRTLRPRRLLQTSPRRRACVAEFDGGRARGGGGSRHGAALKGAEMDG
eukprot:6201137-Pleurochrysis_carterae.AAC.2